MEDDIQNNISSEEETIKKKYTIIKENNGYRIKAFKEPIDNFEEWLEIVGPALREINNWK
jgi:hypothetical protein